MSDGCVEMWAYVGLVTILFSPVLFRENSKIRYHAKFLFYYCYTSLVAIVLIPDMFRHPKDVRNSLRSTYLTWVVAPILGIHFELENGTELAEVRGAFVVSNHQSTFDILGMFCIWSVPEKVAAIAKKEIFYVWPFGLAAWLAGVFFIDRSSPKKSYQTLKEAARLLADNTKIWIFPEGTRNKKINVTKELLPFKRGAFKMAVECQAPVIPVVYSPYYFMDPSTGFFGQGRVRIKALSAISTVGLTDSDVEPLMAKTRDLMQRELSQMFVELEASLPATHPFLLKMKEKETEKATSKN